MVCIFAMVSLFVAGCGTTNQLAKNMEKKNIAYGTKGMFIKFNLGFVKENMYIPCIDMMYAFGSQWFIDSPEAGSINVMADMIKSSNGSGVVTANANGLTVDGTKNKEIKVDTSKVSMTPIVPIKMQDEQKK